MGAFALGARAGAALDGHASHMTIAKLPIMNVRASVK
jgi:hypothetical protein